MPIKKTMYAVMEISLETRAASQGPMNAIDSFIDTQPSGSFATFQYRENKSDPVKPYRLMVQLSIVVDDRKVAANAFRTFVNSALFESGAVADFDLTYKEKNVPAPPAEE